jgi:hypothetical protein
MKFLLPGSPADSSHYATAFLQGLREIGYMNRGAAVIAAGGPPAVTKSLYG